MSLDVLDEDPLRLALARDAGDVGPEVARVFRSALVPAGAEGLAGVARRDEIHRATPRPAVEGGKVIPDRRLIQGRVFHPGHEGGRREGVPLNEANGSKPGFRDVQAELQAAVSRAERETSNLVSGSSVPSGMKSHNARPPDARGVLVGGARPALWM